MNVSDKRCILYSKEITHDSNFFAIIKAEINFHMNNTLLFELYSEKKMF